jgi:hypothetical protein
VKRVFLVTFLLSSPAWSLSPEAQEFMAISKELEPVQCEKRKLRREIALAEAERRDAKELRDRFARINRDPKTSRLEKRLGQLEPHLLRSSDPEDLDAINGQRREAFYRCD